MKQQNGAGGLKNRIRTGTLTRQDLLRRLGELAFGKANDCVRLAFETQPELDKLDLSLLSELRRSDKGVVEIRLVDRLKAIEQLARAAGGEETELESFLQALQPPREAEP